MSCELESNKNKQNKKNYCSNELKTDVPKHDIKTKISREKLIPSKCFSKTEYVDEDLIGEGREALDYLSQVDGRNETIKLSLPKRTAEQESQLFYYRNKTKESFDNILKHEEEPIHLTWLDRKRDFIIDVKDAIVKLLDLEDPELEITEKSQICAYITSYLKRKGLDESQTTWVRKVLAPEFKDPDTSKRYGDTDGERDYSRSNNLQVLVQDFAIPNLYKLDHEGLRKVRKKLVASLDHVDFVGKEKGVAFVDHREKLDPVTTKLADNPHETDSYKAAKGLKEDLLRCGNSVGKIEERLFQFPIEDKKIDRQTTQSINEYRAVFNALTEYFSDIADLRATDSPVEWLRILSIAEEEGLGKAVSVSKGIDINGKTTKLTKKQIKKSSKQKLDEFNNLLVALGKLGTIVSKLSEWKDKSRLEGGGGVYDSIVTRKNKLSPVLSEGAFGTNKGDSLL